jgi:uncharacterized membrane protein YfcA
MDWHYWYMFPLAILICTLASASGFSGSVLFQPVYYFIARVPLHQSIATGIATETVGMTTAALTYLTMNEKGHTKPAAPRIDVNAVKSILPFVLGGVFPGLIIFVYAPKDLLRFAVGVVVVSLSIYQIQLAKANSLGFRHKADLSRLTSLRYRIYQVLAGAFSASTGTGVAEMSQPMLEEKGGLLTHVANASAITLEALADMIITATNLKLDNLRFDILVFTVSGVIVGGQLGPRISRYLPAKSTKISFGICVLIIGVTYIVISLASTVNALIGIA